MKYETEHITGKFTDIWEDKVQGGWELVYFSEQHLISFWKKEIKTTVTPIAGKETKEYLEFIEYYRKQVNDKASYAKTIPRKYEIAREDKNPETGEKFTHKELMDNIKQYGEHIKAFKGYPVGVQVYLNQRRYVESYETVKVDYSEKWITDIMREREISEDIQNRIMKEARLWRKTNEPVQQFTANRLEQMIEKYWVRKEY